MKISDGLGKHLYRTLLYINPVIGCAMGQLESAE